MLMQVMRLQRQADEAATALSQSQDAAQQAVTERAQAESKARADMKACPVPALLYMGQHSQHLSLYRLC